MKYDKYAQQFLSNIKDCMSEELKNFVTIKSAIVDKINENGTINVQFPEDGGVWSNITNQSIYQDLQVGDEVKLIQQNGKLKNCWIIGTLQPLKKQNILETVNNQIKEEQSKIQLENSYLNTSGSDVSSEPNLDAKENAHKYCIHSVTTDSGITDFLYFSKRVDGNFKWVKIV